jgi:hypothetical protein
LVKLQFLLAKKEQLCNFRKLDRVIVAKCGSGTMHKGGGVLLAVTRMKSFWYGAILAAAFLALAPNTQAQSSAAEAQNARAWPPGVADKKGRVINPIVRKEKNRVAPIDRGVDPDAISPKTATPLAAPTPPPAVVTPNSSKGSSAR